jgi:hypothetical protein
MIITLRAGEYLWAASGYHICGDNGFALKCTEDTDVEFDDDTGASVLEIVHADRELRGMNPDTGLPFE